MNIKFLNLLRPHKKGTMVERRKIEEMNKFKIYIYIYMEKSQGHSLYSYVKQTKMSFFILQNQRTGGQNRACLGRLVPVAREGCGERM
jgi:hypothetical protein